MKVVRLKPLLLALFVTIMFCSYVLFCIAFLFFFGFIFCLFGFLLVQRGGGLSWNKENIFLTKIANHKLSFNQQFRYMSFMYQQHMKDLFVLFLPRWNSREAVSVRQILNANSSAC